MRNKTYLNVIFAYFSPKIIFRHYIFKQKQKELSPPCFPSKNLLKIKQRTPYNKKQYRSHTPD